MFKTLILPLIPTDFTVQDKNNARMVVIGAGLPRTGTLSLREALGKLLNGKVYHMGEVFLGGQEHADFWKDLCQGNASSERVKEFFSDYCAGVDFPFSQHFHQFMHIYPDAKIILSVRNPDSWPESVKNSIGRNHILYRTFPVSWVMSLMGWTDVVNVGNYMNLRGCSVDFQDVMDGTTNEGVKLYHEWLAMVKKTVPEDRLLVFDVKEGWEPLCKFLDKPIPNEPFPRINDKAKMRAAGYFFLALGYGLFVFMPLLLLLLLAFYLF